MSTATHTDAPHRLRELSTLRRVVAGLLTEKGLSLDERNGMIMSDLDIQLRAQDLQRGVGEPGNLPPQAAAYDECELLADSLDGLRRDGGLTLGEQSGISEVFVAVGIRMDSMVELCRLAKLQEVVQTVNEEAIQESRTGRGMVTDEGSRPARSKGFGRAVDFMLRLAGIARVKGGG